jgi:hypothetical protein
VSREFKWSEDAKEQEGKEAKDLLDRGGKLYAEALRLARTAYVVCSRLRLMWRYLGSLWRAW